MTQPSRKALTRAHDLTVAWIPALYSFKASTVEQMKRGVAFLYDEATQTERSRIAAIIEHYLNLEPDSAALLNEILAEALVPAESPVPA